MATLEGYKEAALEQYYRDRWLAHHELFRHRHRDLSPPAHKALVRDINQPRVRVGIEGFRGFAKSTYLEETAVLKAIFREFNYLVIVGASLTRACERLLPIKIEFENNEELLALAGTMKGETWREDKIVLSNGICIQALGRDQAMTGIKHNDWRPDAALVDDVEDPEETRTDAEREGTWNWFIKVFLPGLDHPTRSWVRVLGTRRGNGSLPERIEADGWAVSKFPVEYLDENGERRATWPAKFPLPEIDKMKATYRGDMHTFMQEYMCIATSEADRVFSREMFRVEPRERSWHAVYAMIDPARTTNRTSATTGWAIWSWLSNRLIVWAAGAEMLKPDEIIDLTFTIAEHYNPVWIGVEEDGLNEFILQPLRQEQSRRGRTIPVKPIRAPRGKFDFIRGLQPFFAAGEVIFAIQLPELEAQLLSFPAGRIDAPNALAYALQMRPAAAIYDSLSVESLVAELEPDAARPLYLAANATRSMLAAVLCQYIGGQLRILADWVEEGESAETVPRVAAEAAFYGDAAYTARPRGRDWREELKLPSTAPILARRPVTWIVPPSHGDIWNNVGLEQAIRLLPATVNRGAALPRGRAHLRDLLGRSLHGQSRILACDAASWTLRALAGGYCRMTRKGGGLADEAEPGNYRLLMEGLESLAGVMQGRDENDERDQQPVAYGKNGVPYKSAMPTIRMR